MDVLKFPDPRLEEVSLPVFQIVESTRELARKMIQTMYLNGGMGLAAPQVGHRLRMIVIDTEWTTLEERRPLVAINPLILEYSTETVINRESCLSVPDLEIDIERPKNVKVSYRDFYDTFRVDHLTGLKSICFQHEMDHLEGILFIDKLSRLKRSMYIKKLKKRLKQST